MQTPSATSAAIVGHGAPSSSIPKLLTLIDQKQVHDHFMAVDICEHIDVSNSKDASNNENNMLEESYCIAAAANNSLYFYHFCPHPTNTKSLRKSNNSNNSNADAVQLLNHRLVQVHPQLNADFAILTVKFSRVDKNQIVAFAGHSRNITILVLKSPQSSASWYDYHITKGADKEQQASVVKGNYELEGHGGKVFTLDFHPTRREWLFSGSEDSSVRMWDIITRRPVCIFGGQNGHLSHVLCMVCF